MKKRIQSIISCVLVLVMVGMVFGDVIPVNAAITSTTKEEVLFEDDFSYSDSDTNATKQTNMKALGWDNSSYLNQTRAGYAANGVYTVPLDMEIYLLTLGNADALTWSEYTVEADVMLPTISETTTNNNAFLVLNADTNSVGGYEFGIQYTDKGEGRFVLRRRAATDSYDGIVYKTMDYDFSAEEPYTLRLTYANGILYGYCENELVASYDTSQDDVMISKGAAGIRKYGKELSVVYDNFKVTSVEKNVLLSEDFTYDSLTDFTSAGWNYALEDGFTITNGALTTDFSATNTISTNSVEGVAAWNDYTVEADVTLNPGNVVEEKTACVGFLGRTELDGTYGYEFCLVINSSSKVTARVRELASSNTTLVSGVSVNSELSETATYHLKMHFYGDRISFYVDDMLVYTSSDATYTTGAAGIKVIKPDTTESVDNPLTATVDDFQVTMLREDVVEELGNYSDTFSSSKLVTTSFSEVENSSDTYSVEADVTITPDSVLEGTACAGILCRYYKDTNKKDNLYELCIVLNASNKVTARFRNLSAGSGVKDDQKTITIANTLSSQTTYHLEIRSSSSEIQFYADGELVCTLPNDTTTAITHTSGNAGYRVIKPTAAAETCPVVIKNFKVVSTTTTESPLLGDVDADAIISNADLNNLNQQLWEGTSENADVNVDASTDAADLVRLIKIIEYYDFEYKLY